MKKVEPYENWAMAHILEFWVMQDEFNNSQSIKLYEELYKKEKGLRKILGESLELLYAERKEIAFRKAHFGSEAGGRVLRWG